MSKDSWTPNTLKQYTDARIDDLRKDIASQLNEIEKSVERRFHAVKDAADAQAKSAAAATEKVADANEKRFEGVNEFRQSLNDQQAHLANREATEQNFKQMETRMVSLEKASAADDSKSKGFGMVWAIIAGAALLISQLIATVAILMHLSK